MKHLRHKAITAVILSCTLLTKVYAQKTELNPNPVDTSILNQLQDDVSDNIPLVSLDENDGQDGSAQNVSSQLSAGRDPFFNAASFKFNAVRFRIRGYDADLFGTNMNGVQMENLDNGFTPFGLWGGLNDVLRNRDNTLGLRPTPYAFGDLGGMNYLDTRAFRQRAQTSVNYARSNRNYVHRLMATHSTGMNKKGWAFSVSGSRRWADEGFADGTYYDGWSFYAGVDKRINSKHMLSLVVFATPTENGRQGSSIQEMRTLSGDNFYNPFWGYQNGVKRNASIGRTNQPFGILTHEWKPNEKVSLMTSFSMTSGERSVTGLDWYNAPDPRPDYYRYLPSYQQDPNFRNQMFLEMSSDVNKRQINWDALYRTNYGSFEKIQNANGIEGNTVMGRRSKYVLEERVINTLRTNLSTTLNATIAENVQFSGGASYQSQRNSYFKRLEDLLGGDFYVDVNQFAERFFPSSTSANQNDLLNPNRILKEGDRFGFNYDINISRAAVWMQSVFTLKKWDLFISSEHSFTSFYRTGYVKSGIFPNNSFGQSPKYQFFNSSVKGGATYKINGRNYAYLNAAYMSRAPFFENAFIAPRTRDFVQPNLKSEDIGSIEAGYAYNAPNLKIRANGYYTQFKNQMNVITFYSDEFNNFVNYAMENIGKVHVGAEFGLETKIYQGLSLNAAAALGDYFFNTRQKATVTVDNSSEVLDNNMTVYSKNFYVPTPQQAFSIGLDYRSPKFWFVNLNVNYFDKMYLDFNPVRRSEAAVNGVPQNSALWRDIIDQTRLKGQYSVDVFAGYSWLMNRQYPGMKKKTYLVFNMGINNLLNNINMVTGGFEQLRFDFANKNTQKFPDRRFYAYGLTYFTSVGIRF